MNQNLTTTTTPVQNNPLFKSFENREPHSINSLVFGTFQEDEEEMESFNFENALPRSLLHSPPEYNNSCLNLSSLGSKKDLDLVSSRLNTLAIEPEVVDEKLLSKFLNRAKKSNIKVEIPPEKFNKQCTLATSSSSSSSTASDIDTHVNENFDRHSHTALPITVHDSQLMMGTTSCGGLPTEKQRPSEKYNVHAYPFIPTITSSESVSRMLKITRPGSTLSSLFALCAEHGDILKIHVDSSYGNDSGIVAFYDKRSAMSAFNKLTNIGLKYGRLTVEYIFSQEQQANTPTAREALYMCKWSSLQVSFSRSMPAHIWIKLVEILGHCGNIESWNHAPAMEGQGRVFHFFDVRAAVSSFQLLGQRKEIDGFVFTVGFYNKHTGMLQQMTNQIMSLFYQTVTREDVDDSYMLPRKYHSEYPVLKSTLLTDTENFEDNLKNGYLDLGQNHRRVSSFGYDEYYQDSFGSGQGLEAANSGSRELEVVTKASVSKNNIVDLRRISKGLDTRTTLMLRNIPNKVDQQMLKEYLDVTNKNTYDFLYLRIDFANKCNVGYAFVSFISPEHIITFAKARAGTKWNRFNSEKICDISYANIYGKECLIEKFRNSSVMDQTLSYRPLLFHSDGELVGQPQEFPPPNNMNRKMRSIANIERIGLFSPHPKSAPSDGLVQGAMLGSGSMAATLPMRSSMGLSFLSGRHGNV